MHRYREARVISSYCKLKIEAGTVARKEEE